MKTKKVIVSAMMVGIVGMSAEASYLGSCYGAVPGGVWFKTPSPWITQQGVIFVPFESRCDCVCEPIGLKFAPGLIDPEKENEALQAILPYVDGVRQRAQATIDETCKKYEAQGKNVEEWKKAAFGTITLYRAALNLMMWSKMMTEEQWRRFPNDIHVALPTELQERIVQDMVDPNPKRIGENDLWGVNQATEKFWSKWER